MAKETHLRDLKPDPKNARKHTAENVGLIEKSLREVGAARSIVVDENGVVLAGNGVVEAAAAAGIEKVRIVEASGNEIIAVRRRGLTDKQKQRLALFDNRASDLSDWEGDVLEELASEGALEGIFSDDEVKGLIETPELEEVGDEIDEGGGVTMSSGTMVSLPVIVDEVGMVEKALAATGLMNRGAALMAICRAYLTAQQAEREMEQGLPDDLPEQGDATEAKG